MSMLERISLLPAYQLQTPSPCDTGRGSPAGADDGRDARLITMLRNNYRL